MVEPQPMSERTTNSWTGTPARSHTSLNHAELVASVA